MKNKRTASKPPKINPLDSPQWISESTREAGAAASNGSGSWSPSYSPTKPPGGVGLSVNPGILCCGVGTELHAVASAEGPNHKKVPVTLTWPGGSRTEEGIVRETYIVTAEDCGTVLPFTGTANGKTRIAKVPVVKFTTLTEAVVPTDRGRRKLGVGEPVAITLSPGIGTVTWKPPAIGTLFPLTGHVVTYTAPGNTNGGVTENVVIEATLKTTEAETTIPKQVTCSLAFEIKEPTDILMENSDDPPSFFHDQGSASAGFCARVHILPEDVCFYKIEVLEGTCLAVADGWYAPYNGLEHPRWNAPVGVLQDTPEHPSLMDGSDAVYAWDPPDPDRPWAPGTFIWNIPWLFICGGMPEKQFTTAEHKAVMTGAGAVTLTKKQMAVTKALNDPNSDVVCCAIP